MNRRSRSLGENALRFQLDAAKQRITSLEGYIRDRERSFQVVLNQQVQMFLIKLYIIGMQPWDQCNVYVRENVDEEP